MRLPVMLAMQAVLVGLCVGLARSSDEGRIIVERAFGYADAIAAMSADQLGAKQLPEHLQSFVRVVEQLRHAALKVVEEP